NDGEATQPAMALMEPALRATLIRPDGHPVDFHVENLDILSHPEARLDADLASLLAKKYADTSLDAVIAFGPGALEFAHRHRSRLWREGYFLSPGVPAELVHNRDFGPKATGWATKHDLSGAVELALQLRPATKRVVVVSGSSDFDKRMARVAREQLDHLAKRV